MTPEARHIADHEGLVQFLYDCVLEADYFGRQASGSRLRRGLDEILTTGRWAVRAGPVEREEAYAMLRGMVMVAEMNNGTPRTQAVVNLIQDIMTVAWCSRGAEWGTPEMRERYDYLREVERRGAFFIPEIAKGDADAP